MTPDTDPTLEIIHRRSGDAQRSVQLGPYQIEPLIDRTEEAAGTVYRVTVAPNQTTAVSYHRRAEEYYFVLAGGGTAVLNGREYPLEAGDFLRLPPGTHHGFRSGPQGLVMLDVHTPGCRPDRDTYFVDATPEGFGP